MAGLGLDEELGEIDNGGGFGDDDEDRGGFAEYHSVGIPDDVGTANDEVEERFRKVMAMEETRGREHQVAMDLGMSRHRPGGIAVQVEV